MCVRVYIPLHIVSGRLLFSCACVRRNVRTLRCGPPAYCAVLVRCCRRPRRPALPARPARFYIYIVLGFSLPWACRPSVICQRCIAASAPPPPSAQRCVHRGSTGTSGYRPPLTGVGDTEVLTSTPLYDCISRLSPCVHLAFFPLFCCSSSALET